MKIALIILLLLISIDFFGQSQLPIQDTTQWTDFRDSNYNPNIDTIAKKFDSIYSAFIFRIDSIVATKLLVIDSFKFSNDTTVITGIIDIDSVIFDTIRFKDGTKQSTAYSP